MFEPHLQCIVPFIEDKSGRDEFENLFKSIPVVPSIYWDDYSAHIKAKEYYEAEGYVAQIQDYRFCQLKKDGQICRDEDLQKWIITVEYDETLGLLLDKYSSCII